MAASSAGRNAQTRRERARWPVRYPTDHLIDILDSERELPDTTAPNGACLA